jgi:hypothetical protein
MRRTLIALALVGGLVAACGSSAATGAPQTTPTQAATTAAGGTAAGGTAAAATPASTAANPGQLDACALITADDAAAALGEPVDPGTVPTPGARSCLFSGHPATGIDMNAVEISITSVAAFKPDQKSIAGLTITPVSGIGDAAYYVSMGAGMTVLDVRKGQVTFTAAVVKVKASDAELQSAEKTLAMAVLGRI